SFFFQAEDGLRNFHVTEVQTCALPLYTTAVTLQELAALREGPGGDLGISGSPTLVASLLSEGLLDELHLLVHPLVAGTGKRLFEHGDHIPLKLTASQTFATGVLDLTYERA